MDDYSHNLSIRTTENEEETLRLGESIAQEIRSDKPAVIALVGDLGAGKTTLAKGIVHGLTRIPYDEVTSPTFQYASLFQAPSGMTVAHCDLWRLRSCEEFLELGLGDLLTQAICIIEWPERIDSILPPSTKTCVATWEGESQRQFRYWYPYRELIHKQ